MRPGDARKNGFAELSADLQGAQASAVPIKNGSAPEVPEGRQSTQPGAVLEGALAALAEDPPEPARVDEVSLAPPEVDWPADVPPAAAARPVDPAPEPALVVLFVEGAAPAADTDEPSPRVTTPLDMAPPGVVTVCATAGTATAKAAGNSWNIRCVIPREIVRTILVQVCISRPSRSCSKPGFQEGRIEDPHLHIQPI